MISTRLVVSSGLRAVVLVLPIAVIPGLPGPYEQAKVWWLQVIVPVIALAWVLERALGQDPTAVKEADRPLTVLRWLLVAYAAWSVLATVVSVVPGQSLLGSFERGFGLLTILSAAALFPLVQASCGMPDHRRSLVDTALVASVPVGLLALGQVVGWDRLPATHASTTTAMRVHSTIGQHVFLGSYLVVLIPLATVRCLLAGATNPRVPYRVLGFGAVWVAGMLVLVRLAGGIPGGWFLLPLWGIVAVLAWDRCEDACDRGQARGIPQAVLFGALAALQVVVVVLCGARGPFLALIVAMAIIGATVRRRGRSPSMTMAAKGALVLLVSLGVVLAVVGWWQGGLRTASVLERLAMRSGSEARDSVTDRLQMWAAITDSLGRQLAGEEVIPGQDPRLRSVVGYGPDTQFFIIDSFVSAARGPTPGARQTRLVYDRAHDVFLDHIATGGFVAIAIWIALLSAILVVGVRRLRDAGEEDWLLRLGCFGAVVGHIVEGLSGVETVVPFALFWIVAAILTAPLSSARERSQRRVATLWAGGGVALAAIGCFAVAATSIWLMGSHMYMHGIALARSGRLVDASRELEQATALVPWLPGPRSMAGEAGFRVAELEADPARRAAIRRQAQALLATPYGGTAVSADVWQARGRVALARARDGEPGQLPGALAAFSRADRLRPNDQQILTALSVALLTDGQAAQARALAERLVLRDAENTFAWMVVARASTRLGDQDRARRAERQVRGRARPEELPFFDALR